MSGDFSDDSRKSLKDFLGSDSDTYPNTAANATDKNNISLSSLTSDPNAGEVAPDIPLLNSAIDAEAGLALLSDYVNYITKHFHKDSGNEFFIEGGQNHKDAAAMARGEPIPEYTNRQGADSTFIYQKDYDVDGNPSIDKLGSTLADYSNSGKWDTVYPSRTNVVGGLINKTGTISDAPNGNHIFDAINPNGYPVSTPIDDDMAEPVKSSFAMLKEHNRFSVKAGNEYGYENILDDTVNEDGNPVENTESFTTAQDEKGKYTTSDPVKINKLKNVGYQILKNAAMFPDSVLDADYSPASQESVSPGKTTDGETFGAGSGAFEKAQANQKIKTSFTSPDNKFTGVLDGTGKRDYFNGIIASFLDNDNTGIDITDEGPRQNNSVYTVNSYNDSINKAIETYFGDTDFKHDPFFVNIANVLTGIIKGEADENTPGNARSKLSLKHEKIAARKFLDTMAVLGDVLLELDVSPALPGGGGGRITGGIWDVDALKAGPATRISKSKTSPGDHTLVWNSRATPAVYHLPSSVIRSMQNMGAVNGQSPMKGMLATDLVNKTYFSAGLSPLPIPGDGAGAAALDQLLSEAEPTYMVPKMLIRQIEDKLDAEYVPFYFHDLRTNEIISFHAFLSDLTDSFKADYESNDGFGRMDPVRIYKSTTRDIGFSFKVVATSERDFDEMWFKINKLITLLYPQWSEGEMLSAKIGDNESKFIRPFSQVPVGSPMIRLRVGDVIKSNYSRFNLSRIFGSGNSKANINPAHVKSTSLLGMISEIPALAIGGTDVNAEVQKVQITVAKVMLKAICLLAGSPLQITDLIPDDTMLGLIIKDVAFQALFNAMDKDGIRGGMMSPALNSIYDRFKNPDDQHNEAGMLSTDIGARVGDAIMLKPSMEKFYLSPKDGVNKVRDYVPLGFILLGSFPKDAKKYMDPLSSSPVDNYINTYTKIRTTRHVKCRVVGIQKKTDGITYYNVVAVSTESGDVKSKGRSIDIEGTMFVVKHDDFIFDPDYIFGGLLAPLLDPISGVMDKLQDMVDMFAGSLGISTDNINLFTTSFEDFMHPVNNSITKSFETTNGRGLAGFISSMSFKWIDDNIPWETKFGGRAPKVCDITVKFEPVHDIAPGLDKSGFNRAPTHNVGTIMNNMAGDPYEKGHDSAKKLFDRAMNDARKKVEWE